MPLKVVIVGAGIAGLCAGVALRQAGHNVEIYEKSRFANEIGAALIITSNGARVLSQLGFSFATAQALKMDSWNVVKGDNFEPVSKVDLSSAEKMFGAPIWSVHRVDLHNELYRLATSETEFGQPVHIHLASEVIGASTDGSIELKTTKQKPAADLIIAADGLHSTLKSVVLEQDSVPASPTGLAAFRFLIDTQKMQESSTLSRVLDKGAGATLLADTKEVAKERHIMWYPCRGGKVQNFVGIHPQRQENGDYPADFKSLMLDEFSHFSSDVLEIIRESSDIKCWPLHAHKPVPKWFNGQIVLIGDAVHPMLPFGGQGSNIAIEDAGSLGYLLKGVNDLESLTERLQLFERSRKARASRVQILSSVRAGREKEVEEELRRYADPPYSVFDFKIDIPTNMIERTIHDYSFDIYKKCDNLIEDWKKDKRVSSPRSVENDRMCPHTYDSIAQ